MTSKRLHARWRKKNAFRGEGRGRGRKSGVEEQEERLARDLEVAKIWARVSSGSFEPASVLLTFVYVSGRDR